MKRYVNLTLENYDGEMIELQMSLGSRELITCQRIYREITGTNATFTEIMGLLNVGDGGDLDVILSLVCASVHEINKLGVVNVNPIGFKKFDDEFPLLKNLDKIMQGLKEVMEDVHVEPSKDDMGK